MSTLECKYDQWEGMPVVQLEIQKLFQSVPIANDFQGVPFYDSIKADIEENGLNFPLLVVDAKFWQLLDQWNIHKLHMMPLPTNFDNKDQILVVWGGSNRLAIAKELGYTRVDCVVFTDGDFQGAWTKQGEHRKDYMHLYNGIK